MILKHKYIPKYGLHIGLHIVTCLISNVQRSLCNRFVLMSVCNLMLNKSKPKTHKFSIDKTVTSFHTDIASLLVISL